MGTAILAEGLVVVKVAGSSILTETWRRHGGGRVKACHIHTHTHHMLKKSDCRYCKQTHTHIQYMHKKICTHTDTPTHHSTMTAFEIPPPFHQKFTHLKTFPLSPQGQSLLAFNIFCQQLTNHRTPTGCG